MRKICIIKATIPILGLFLLLQCCKLDKDFCRLSSFDKKFTLEEYESLEYLENGSTRINVKIVSKQNDSWNKNGGWFYTGDGGYESIHSNFYISDSSRFIEFASVACRDTSWIAIWKDRYSQYTSAFYFNKESLSGIERTIQSKVYENCYVFSDTIDIKELIYVKDYGVVKLELLNGYTIELIRTIK
jgi:hypothetical protein